MHKLDVTCISWYTPKDKSLPIILTITPAKTPFYSRHTIDINARQKLIISQFLFQLAFELQEAFYISCLGRNLWNIWIYKWKNKIKLCCIKVHSMLFANEREKRGEILSTFQNMQNVLLDLRYRLIRFREKILII